MRRLLLLLCVLLVAGTAPSGVASEVPQTWERAEPLLHFHNEAQIDPTGPADGDTTRPCATDLTRSGVVVARTCAGLIDSWDGLSLSVRIEIPKTTEPVPTLIYLGGWPDNRGSFTTNPADFNHRSFAGKGYAVVMLAPRGHGGSCGLAPNTGPYDTTGQPQVETPHGPNADTETPDHTCADGYTHIAERSYEIRDMQHLLGLMVDVGVADPDKLIALGGSYGAGQAWLLATSLPWKTPRADRTIQLAAAVPMSGWTSVQNAIFPNGRATDEPDGGGSHDVPFGVAKQEQLLALFAVGRAGGVAGPVRFNDDDPQEKHSHMSGWLEFVHSPEPYDPSAAGQLSQALRGKSALLADDYFAAVHAGTIKPVAVLALSCWCDVLFPPVETLQMYRRLKQAAPGYPIWIHFVPQGRKQVHIDVANAFIDHYALGTGAVPAAVTSISTVCPATSPGAETVTAGDWDATHRGRVTLRSDRSVQTFSGAPNAAEEAPTAPRDGGHVAACATQPLGTYVPSSDYSLDVPSDGLTLLGLPKLLADYRLVGVDATVIAKVWDVDEAQTRTLVTRGVYRLSLAGGDKPEGTLKFQLFGNHYRLAPGHTIQLELSQTDAPFLKPSNAMSSVTYTSVKLELPIR